MNAYQTILSWCFGEHGNTTHLIVGSYRTGANRPMVRLECSECHREKKELGTVKNMLAKAYRRNKTPDAPKRDRADAFTRRPHRVNFIERGCLRCGGSLLRNGWNEMICVSCGWSML